jgi:hypothetical protein
LEEISGIDADSVVYDGVDSQGGDTPVIESSIDGEGLTFTHGATLSFIHLGVSYSWSSVPYGVFQIRDDYSSDPVSTLTLVTILTVSLGITRKVTITVAITITVTMT